MEYLVLLGGGRTEERVIAKRALRDINQVLEPFVPTVKLWLDEHGGLWLKKSDCWQASCINQGRIFEIDCQEMVIGGMEEGKKIQQIWPVIFGKSYDWAGISVLGRIGGCRQIGTSSILSVLLKDNQIASRILSEYQFCDEGILVNRKEWLKNNLEILDKIVNKLSFPIVLFYGEKKQRVSLPESLEGFIAQIFEEQEAVEQVLIKELKDDELDLVIGFVGRKNWLPSKSMILNGDEWLINEDVAENRLVQDMVMNFVSKYDVLDYGLFKFKKNKAGFLIDQIDLFPDLSRLGLYARVWQKSGLNYEELIKKIYIDSIN